MPAVTRVRRPSSRSSYNYVCDHNGIKGYTAVYFVKYVTEKMGKFDSKEFIQTAHGLTITPKQEPGILMDGDVGQERRHRSRELPGEVVERQAEDRQDSAEARQ